MSTSDILLAVLTATSVLMPVAENAARKSRNKTDDKVVAAIQIALSLVPRIRLGSR